MTLNILRCLLNLINFHVLNANVIVECDRYPCNVIKFCTIWPSIVCSPHSSSGKLVKRARLSLALLSLRKMRTNRGLLFYVIKSETFVRNLGARYETRHDLKSTNVKMPPNLSMCTGFGFKAVALWLVIYKLFLRSPNIPRGLSCW